MKRCLFTPYLTSPNPEFDNLVKKTVPGMAHFAGTGPAGKTCGDCQHRQLINKHYRCTRFRSDGQPIGAHLEACKYFVEATSEGGAS